MEVHHLEGRADVDCGKDLAHRQRSEMKFMTAIGEIERV